MYIYIYIHIQIFIHLFLANELLRSLGDASCGIIDETGRTNGYSHWVLRFVVAHTTGEARFVTGIGCRV